MKKKMNEKFRLVLSVATCVLFIATVFSGVAIGFSGVVVGPVESTEGVMTEMEEDGYIPVPFRDQDWDYWTNPPNMYAIPSGNVGIGTIAPEQKFDVEGNAGADTVAKFGEVHPIYVENSWPTIGFNTYLDSGTIKLGKGSSNEFGADITFNPELGNLYFRTHDTAADEHQPVTMDTQMTITKTGNVGIGTTSPSAKLEIVDPEDGPTLIVGRKTGNPSIKSTGIDSNNNGYLIMDSNEGGTSINHYVPDKVLLACGGGNVGIGDITPDYKLDVNGDANIGGSDLYFDADVPTRIHAGRTTWDYDGFRICVKDASGAEYTPFYLTTGAKKGDVGKNARVSFDDIDSVRIYDGDLYVTDGNVGIGTTDPQSKLHVEDISGIIIQGPDASDYYQLYHNANAQNDFGFHIKDGTGTKRFSIRNGNIGIGDTNPNTKLTIKGEGVLIKGRNNDGETIFEIGEGLDYAEEFSISQEEITPGTVVSIDPYNIGSLKISTKAYDKGVAGIVSGANGLSHGVRLGVDEVDGYPIALAGRVYCNVDTQYGNIQPCDLLTTSPTPGHAMVVKDYDQAQGAILGKAMEGLSGGGKGQILVLVTLQ